MLIHSKDFKPSLKRSSLFAETSETAELSKLPSRSFFEASSLLELLPKSRFLDVLSKYLAIYILEYIQLNVNFKYNLYKIHFIIYLWYDNSSRLKHVWSLHLRKKRTFLNFFLNMYIPPWLRKSFTFMVLRLLQIHLWVKKWICSFLLMAPSKTLPQVFIIILQANGKCPFLPNSDFSRYFFLRRKGGEEYEVKKYT